MKKQLLLFYLLFPFMVFGQQVDANKLEERNGLTYEVGKTKPFTGQSITYTENGKEEGEYIWWFENGNLNKKGVYHNGIADGKWEWYYENGQKKQEGILRGATVNDGAFKYQRLGYSDFARTLQNQRIERKYLWRNEIFERENIKRRRNKS